MISSFDDFFRFPLLYHFTAHSGHTDADAFSIVSYLNSRHVGKKSHLVLCQPRRQFYKSQSPLSHAAAGLLAN